MRVNLHKDSQKHELTFKYVRVSRTPAIDAAIKMSYVNENLLNNYICQLSFHYLKTKITQLHFFFLSFWFCFTTSFLCDPG